jgi:hypothetical protein
VADPSGEASSRSLSTFSKPAATNLSRHARIEPRP